MQFALNYSHKAADLLRAGEIDVDLFKCPAWPDLIQTSLELRPTYVHFPLRVGAGNGDALDDEHKQPADWQIVARMLKQTGTPLVNLHLAPGPDEFPDVPVDSTAARHVAQVEQSLLRDVCAVCARFGAENVIVENCHPTIGTILRAACLPKVIERVVAQSGCGLLLDLSHARLAAEALGIDPRAYIAGLPVGRVREIHVTGLQCVDERWASIAGDSSLRPYLGRRMDHLPMTDADWEFLRWALAQIRSGAWRTPWIMTCEYGGVSGAWDAVTFTDVLQAQVPQMYEMVHAG